MKAKAKKENKNQICVPSFAITCPNNKPYNPKTHRTQKYNCWDYYVTGGYYNTNTVKRRLYCNLVHKSHKYLGIRKTHTQTMPQAKNTNSYHFK